MSFKFLRFSLFVLACSITQIYAQDTSGITRDSVNNRILIIQSDELQKLQQERIADSLKQAELEDQIKDLRSTDNLKKAELLKQLQEIREKDSLKRVKQSRKIDSLRRFVKGFPVDLYGDTLFFIFSKQGSFSPKERADAVSRRIEKLAKDYFFSPDSLQVSPSEQTLDILYKSDIIIGISDEDGLWMNTSKDKLAGHYRNLITKAISAYKAATSWQTLLKEILLALLVIVLLVVIVYYISKLFLWTKVKIRSQRGKKFNGIRIKNYKLFNANQEVNFYITINNIVKWLMVLLTIYLGLPLLFGIFPWTKGFADTLLNYFLNPLKKIFIAVWNYLPNLFTIIVIVVVFRYLLKLLHYLKNEIERGALRIEGFYSDWANPTYQIIKVLILAFMLIVIFPYMPGSDSPVFKGVSVFLGVLFTFGSAGALSNIVAGLVLTYMRAFKIGDRVKIGEVSGDIIEKTLLVTRIRTIKNEIISIPNSNVMSSHTINYSSDAIEKGLIIYTTVTIGYDVPWRKVHDLLITAAQKTAFIEQDPVPFVLQTSLDDFYVGYQINAYTKTPNKQAVIYSDLHQNIQDVFNEAGVEIMSPHYRAARDGNASTIPPEYLPEDYQAPPFNIKNQDVKKEGNGK